MITRRLPVVLAGLVAVASAGCSQMPELGSFLDGLVGLVDAAQVQGTDDNGGARPPGTSDDPPGDDIGGTRPDGVSDDSAGDDGGTSGDSGGATGDDGGVLDMRISARLSGSGAGSGNVDYRVESGRRRLKVEVEHFAAGTYDVTINGVVVAEIAVGALGTAEIEFDSKVEPGHVPFPPNFPAQLAAGDEIAVGGVVSGTLG